MAHKTPQAPEMQYSPPPPPAPRSPFEKTPLLAGFLSVLPGLGNIYNGLYTRGLTFAVIWVGLFSLAHSQPSGEALFVPAMIFFWFFNIIDAYRQATLINYGFASGAELPKIPGLERQSSGGLILGVSIFLLGLYGLLRHINPRIDLSILFDFWYLPVLGFGGWLTYTAIRDRRGGDDEASAAMYEEPLPTAPLPTAPLPAAPPPTTSVPEEDDKIYSQAGSEDSSESEQDEDTSGS